MKLIMNTFLSKLLGVQFYAELKLLLYLEKMLLIQDVWHTHCFLGRNGYVRLLVMECRVCGVCIFLKCSKEGIQHGEVFISLNFASRFETNL